MLRCATREIVSISIRGNGEEIMNVRVKLCVCAKMILLVRRFAHSTRTRCATQLVCVCILRLTESDNCPRRVAFSGNERNALVVDAIRMKVIKTRPSGQRNVLTKNQRLCVHLWLGNLLVLFIR